jgi:hypothetical protein
MQRPMATHYRTPIRLEIAKFLFALSGHARQKIELEDRESIIGGAMQLVANMAQHRSLCLPTGPDNGI